MAKVIKLEDENVVISNGDNGVVRVPYEGLDFKPEIHDEVELFQDGESIIVTKIKNKSNSPEDKISINIVNENTQQQQNNNNTYIQAGRVVNKLIYIILALFLGGFGVHKFYAGKTGAGFLYLVFCWTFVPAFLGLISAISAAFKPSDSNGNIII